MGMNDFWKIKCFKAYGNISNFINNEENEMEMENVLLIQLAMRESDNILCWQEC